MVGRHIVFKDKDNMWNFIIYWGHFIDDILVLSGATSDEFKAFLGVLNQNEIKLYFNFESQEESITFLDLNISKGDDGRLSTSTNRKPTQSNNLVHWDSHHPIPLK